MSVEGQTEKNSVCANVFRVTPESGHSSIQSACLKGADMQSESVEFKSRCTVMRLASSCYRNQ